MKSKQLNFTLLFLFILFLSCGDGCSCSDCSDIAPPSTRIQIDGSPSYNPGTEVLIKLEISSSNELKSFIVNSDIFSISTDCKISSTNPIDAMKIATEFRSGLGTTGAVIIQYIFKIPNTATIGTRNTITFTVGDIEGLMTSHPFEFTVVGFNSSK